MHKNRQARGTVPVCAPRRVYIDMGVNWCNTLRLYADLIQRPELLMGRSMPSRPPPLDEQRKIAAACEAKFG